MSISYLCLLANSAALDSTKTEKNREWSALTHQNAKSRLLPAEAPSTRPAQTTGVY